MLHARRDWMEQSPAAIFESVQKVADECVAFCVGAGLEIRGLAIANQRETAVAWDRATGEALGNAISWQCRRSAEICRVLATSAEIIRQRAGLPLDPLLTATKWRWMLEESEAAAELRSLLQSGRLCFGTVDSWLLHCLTRGGAHATDHTNASRTGLLNLHSLEWDADLLQVFGVPLTALPALVPSMGAGGFRASISQLEDVPILAVLGDSHAALAGQGITGPGTVKATYGTGSSLMTLVETLPPDGASLARAIAWTTAREVHYALEGNIAMTGSVVRWLGEFLGLARPVEDVIALAESIEDAAGVEFVPAMAGLGAPYWDFAARGAILNLGTGHRMAHLARAALNAIAHQVADVFEALEQAADVHFTELRADGGATRNSGLMQLQADILGRDVLRSAAEELSALGAAWLAGVELRWWTSVAEPYAAVHAPQRFAAHIDPITRASLRKQWKTAVRRTLTGESA